jgi:hypothetical protein
MSRLVFNSHEAVARVAIIAAEFDGVCDVSVHQDTQGDNRFIAAMPRRQRPCLEGNLPRSSCMRIVRDKAALSR